MQRVKKVELEKNDVFYNKNSVRNILETYIEPIISLYVVYDLK